LRFIHFFGNVHNEPYIMDLRILETEKLFIHEEVVPSNLEKLKKILTKDRILSDPVLVDVSSNVVLDGTHRVQCFKELGYKYILAALVNYFDDRIRLKRWYRVLHGSCRDITNIVEKFGFEKSDSELFDNRNSNIIKAYVDGKMYIYYGKDVYDTYSELRHLERELVERGIRIEYATENKAIEMARRNKSILITPHITKKDVVDCAIIRHVFPPKTTRHVFPIRPIFVNVPLEYFSMDTDVEYANGLLQKYLMNRLVIKISGKVTIDRYYEEDFLIVFL